MFQYLTDILHQRFGSAALGVALALVCAGVAVWLVGSRFSRSILALVGAGAGAWVGVQLPRWFGWHVDSMATGIGCALALGLAGYLLQMTWISFAFATELAALNVLTAWTIWSRAQTLSFASVDWENVNNLPLTLWNLLPQPMGTVLPYVLTGSAIAAALTTFYWPRIARAGAWSMTGLLLIFTFGAAAFSLRGSDPLAILPQHAGGRVAVLWLLAVIGGLLQWWFTPRVQKTDESVSPDRHVEVHAATLIAGFATGGAKA